MSHDPRISLLRTAGDVLPIVAEQEDMTETELASILVIFAMHERHA